MGYNRWRLCLKVLKWLLVLLFFFTTLARFIPDMIHPSIEDYIFTLAAYYATMFGSLLLAMFFWVAEEIVFDTKKHIFVRAERIICCILILASVTFLLILKIYGVSGSNMAMHMVHISCGEWS